MGRYVLLSYAYVLIAALMNGTMASSQARLKEQPPQHTAHTNRLSTTMSRGSIGGGTASTKKTMWLGRGMVNDIRRRAPYYWSDWTDAWDYRIIPSTSK